MLIRGYTLIEMCLILCVTSILLLSLPTMMKSSAILSFEMNRMMDAIKGAQLIAIHKRKRIDVEVMHNKMIVGDQQLIFNAQMNCTTSTFHFNGRGNVSMANTITCTLLDKRNELVINLGNGNVYLR